ncbi:acetate--CoA ligase family protein [Prolixibacter denitrificans]|uniref:Acetyl-CoA synthetase n=1 Tax=Prolixibacter denitrificans TaxID=1541063 RepID=A0A2P8C5M8_9BACT|nr:acetate--CoA ligase [Prolixibacter denitrificans]PSK80262.1 acetyltransferase [Prolixibacter denitrificans]GET23584.1 acetyl-CoA synthetase [Prolixibacter denitrificans]
MLNKQLLSPKSIAVIGASNDVSKPGGKILLNLQEHKYKGKLYAVNPRDPEIQGIKTFAKVDELPMIDLAILAIPAKLCPQTVEILAHTKKTKAFIVISAGFSEESEQGAEWERQMVETVKSVGGVLIGPNCIGALTPEYAGVFTSPIPKFDPKGCDFVSGSGATAVFIMESGIPKGLHFANVFSVGNSAQIGVEEVLEYWDKTYDPETSAPVKMLYVESIHNPDKFLWHASSLIRKGCKIAGIKAGSSEAGSRAASSHTGAMTSSDSAVEALFRKAGIVRCYGREELTTVASIFMFEELKGKNMAIITHAGGPAVMLTDALEDGGLRIPRLPDTKVKAALKDKLFPGSSVENPIDFLATGNAEQLGAIIDACENDFDDIDGMAVIFGSPGLQPVTDVYKVLSDKMKTCKKPIYPILPSVINVQKDVAYFISSGNVNFPDEVLLGRALTKVYRTPKPSDENIYLEGVDVAEIRRVVESCENGYMPPEKIHALLKAASIPFAQERVVQSVDEAAEAAKELGFPLVMKVVGPVHKTEVGGVSLNIRDEDMVRKEFARLMKIKGTTAVLMAEQAEGIELFIGASYQDKFGHVMLCGMGGIFVEVFKDVTSGLAPLTFPEAHSMIRNLKAYKIINGYRGMEGVDKDKFAEIIVRLSSMLRFAVEIKEMDLNPLLGKGDRILAVDARIRIEK